MRVEEILQALGGDPVGFALFRRIRLALRQDLHPGKPGPQTPIFQGPNRRDEVNVGNLAVTASRGEAILPLPFDHKGIEKKLSPGLEAFAQRFERCDRIAAVIEHPEAKEGVERLFVMLDMLDAEKFVLDPAAEKAVEKSKLAVVERRGIETDQLRRLLALHPKEIVAVVAADVSDSFALEVEMGFEQVVFELTAPLAVDKERSQSEGPLAPGHQPPGDRFDLCTVAPLVVGIQMSRHRIAQLHTRHLRLGQRVDRLLQGGDVFPAQPATAFAAQGLQIHHSWTVALRITCFFRGLSPGPVGTLSILSTTFCPRITSPKMV